ncbi:MAG: hypothetical protein B7Z33_09595 [Sphingomonadales bacterium 12-68-11]|nr:MAG: hypothetical protein B7Z33_09595 [Sphingomonadales bacterium 12-68-11]
MGSLISHRTVRGMTALGLAGAALALPGIAQAQLVTYSGGDDHATQPSQLINTLASASAFDAAVPSATLYDFESPAPAGLSWSIGSILNGVPVAGCEWRCGYNTTSGGEWYLSHPSGWMTFTFDNPINAFGVVVTGLQASLVGGATWVQFNDGAEQSIYLPAVEGGGGAFIGFTNLASSFSSVSFYSRSDILGFDDLRFGFVQPGGGAGAVPEPATWAMMILGFAVIGGALRSHKRREKLTVTYA